MKVYHLFQVVKVIPSNSRCNPKPQSNPIDPQKPGNICDQKLEISAWDDQKEIAFNPTEHRTLVSVVTNGRYVQNIYTSPSTMVYLQRISIRISTFIIYCTTSSQQKI